jgi:hypothetical protein
MFSYCLLHASRAPRGRQPVRLSGRIALKSPFLGAEPSDPLELGAPVRPTGPIARRCSARLEPLSSALTPSTEQERAERGVPGQVTPIASWRLSKSCCVATRINGPSRCTTLQVCRSHDLERTGARCAASGFIGRNSGDETSARHGGHQFMRHQWYTAACADGLPGCSATSASSQREPAAARCVDRLPHVSRGLHALARRPRSARSTMRVRTSPASFHPTAYERGLTLLGLSPSHIRSCDASTRVRTEPIFVLLIVNVHSTTGLREPS